MRLDGIGVRASDLLLIFDGEIYPGEIIAWMKTLPANTTIFLGQAEEVEQITQEYNQMGQILEQERRLLEQFTITK